MKTKNKQTKEFVVIFLVAFVVLSAGIIGLPSINLVGKAGEPIDIEDIIIDDDESETTYIGTWTESTGAPNYHGTGYRHDRDEGPGKSATFTPDIETAGDYDVFLWWTSHPNRADDVLVTITHETGTDQTTVNQREDGSQWNPIGNYPFSAGTGNSVMLSSSSTNSGYTIADAAKFVYTGEGEIVDCWDPDPLTDPHPICTCADLQKIDTDSDTLSWNYELQNNINCSETATWNPIPWNPGVYLGFDPIGMCTGYMEIKTYDSPFTGTLDGNDFTISDLYSNRSERLPPNWGEKIGLFACIKDSTIKNLKIENITIYAYRFAGGLTSITNNSIIKNVDIQGNVTAYTRLGLVAHYSDETSLIINTNSTGIVDGMNSVGFISENKGTIQDCNSIGPFYGYHSNFAGLVKYNEGIINNSHVIGDIHSTVPGTFGASGLVSSNRGYIINSSFIGNVYGIKYVGGLLETNSAEGIIENSYSISNISATGNYAGGLVNNNIGLINNSYSKGTVSGRNYVGGLVGFSSGSIIDSHSTSSVIGIDQVGGLAGVNDGELIGLIERSYATGPVSGETVIGGLVGYNVDTGIITDSFATGSVSGDGGIGGLVGYGWGKVINNSYATGDVTSTEYGGGLIGYLKTDTVINSFATGDVTSDRDSGGLTGINYEANIINSYWYNNENICCGSGNCPDCYKASDYSDFYDISYDIYDTNLPHWDFTNSWSGFCNQEGYPSLKNENIIDIADCRKNENNCNTPADNNPCNGIVDNIEIAAYVTDWKQGGVTNPEIALAVTAWKNS